MATLFSTNYIISEEDIGACNHLGNERALVIFQKGRTDFLRHLGFSDSNIGANIGDIIVESGVKYHNEGFLHDALTINVTVAERAEKKFTLKFSVIRAANGQELLSGYTILLAFDYQAKKVIELPKIFIEKTEPFLIEKVAAL